MSYYTSYETSVALRDAGAPQGAGAAEPLTYPQAWFIGLDGKRTFLAVAPYDARNNDAAGARAWRLDEILEALAAVGLLDLTQRNRGGKWECYIETWEASYNSSGASPVEAAAACWLAVLRGKP